MSNISVYKFEPNNLRPKVYKYFSDKIDYSRIELPSFMYFDSIKEIDEYFTANCLFTVEEYKHCKALIVIDTIYTTNLYVNTLSRSLLNMSSDLDLAIFVALWLGIPIYYVPDRYDTSVAEKFKYFGEVLKFKYDNIYLYTTFKNACKNLQKHLPSSKEGNIIILASNEPSIRDVKYLYNSLVNV